MDIFQSAVQVLPYLEGTKYNAANDLLVTSVALKMTFEENKNIWSKDSKERKYLLSFIGNELTLKKENFSDVTDEAQNNFIMFMQGLIIMGISVINGIGRAPLEIVSSTQEEIKLRSNQNTFSLDVGKYNQGMETLISEFKKHFYGTVASYEFTNDDLAVILESFQETVDRFDIEIAFMKEIATNPTKLWKEQKNFSSLFFVLVSALPIETLNNLFMEISSFLPNGIEVRNEEGNMIDLKNYFGVQTVESKEIFRKIRLLLKNYFGNQREILGMIVRENMKVFFEEALENKMVKETVSRNIEETIENQFATRKNIFESFLKLLK